MNTKLKWTRGNSKLKKLDTIGFGIPADYNDPVTGVNSCPMAGACRAVCYAKQGSYTWDAVSSARRFNFTLAQSQDFGAMLISDLAMIKNKLVRIHDSGDFFNQGYLNAWLNAALAYPEKTFYAYTKSLHLDFSQAPKNFKLTQSQGGKLDRLMDKARPHSRIFSSDKAREQAGYVDGNETDKPAIQGKIKIGLVYHGTRNLTQPQARYFS